MNIKLSNNKDTAIVFIPHDDDTVTIHKYTDGQKGRAFTRTTLSKEDARLLYSMSIKVEGFKQCQEQ